MKTGFWLGIISILFYHVGTGVIGLFYSIRAMVKEPLHWMTVVGGILNSIYTLAFIALWFL